MLQAWQSSKYDPIFVSLIFSYHAHMALRKNGLGNMEENNLICDLARAHHGNPKIPKKEQKKGIGSYQSPFKKKSKEIPTRWVIDTQENCDIWVLKMKLAD